MVDESKQKVISLIESYRDSMVGTMSKMVAIPSISPLSDGEGEGKRADFLEGLLRQWGFDVKRYEYEDETRTKRPNLVAKLGNKQKTVWFVAHMDTVAPGDRSLWKTDPFRAEIKDGKIYGRGTNDNGQDLVSAIYALKALKDSGVSMRFNMGVALVADEELGSRYGIQKLLEESGIFGNDDMFVVPDYLSKDGTMVEIAEKGSLWLKIKVNGKQVHASTPALGVNANRYASRLITKIDEMLHQKYNATDPIYQPEYSTFEPTKREKNVDSVNIVPGSDVFYFDCRVLPNYKLDEVLNDVKSVCSSNEFKEVKVDIETFSREDPAAPTSMDSEVVKLLLSSIKELRGIDAKPMGVGGGTCAAFFRHKGYPSVAWGTEFEDMAHQPNEYCRIDDMVADSKVFASMCL
ncbi:MAG: M20 family metallo-hydrolase [Candidatus Marsarchaeota archaeon]|nr:M20 family metallo-hydrolase [Candidatus Marsarchaeota archaeon]